jgi:hypothetical protein
MKNPRSLSPWDDLVHRARGDATPPIDVPALLRAVRQTPLPVESDWTTEFAATFASRRAWSIGLAAACVLVCVGGWQANELSQALLWADWLAMSVGGGQ